MDFSRRLKLYLIGVLFGCTMVYFMLIRNRGRDFSWWFPSDRVTAELKDKSFSITPQAEEDAASLNITAEEAERIAKTGNVNFTKSKARAKPCAIYAIEGYTAEGKELRVTVEDCDKQAKIAGISVP